MSDSKKLLIFKMSKAAQLPVRSSVGAAGYDLYSIENIIVPARGQALVSTGLLIQVPSGTYGRIAPRSGLAVKHCINVGAGVIDSDYRGEVKIVLFNHSTTADFAIKAGDRIAQLILECIVVPPVEESSDLLSTTVRGTGGFGSTGN